jgi:hypothetical protein
VWRAQAIAGSTRTLDSSPRLGDLGAGVAEHVAEDQHSGSPRGHVLQRGDEGKLDRFPLLASCLRSGASNTDFELTVGVRPDPGRLDQWGTKPGVWVGGRVVVDRQHPDRSSLDHAQADVGRDHVQQRAQRAAPFIPSRSAARLDQGFLYSALRILDRVEHPVAVRLERPAMRLDQLGEGSLVTPDGRCEQR